MAGFPAAVGSGGSEGSWDISCGCAANVSLDYVMTHRLQVADSMAELNMAPLGIGVFQIQGCKQAYGFPEEHRGVRQSSW